jgi:hypothetical protein
VLRRIAELDETDPEIIREVEQQIESILSDQLRTVRKRSAGLAAASAILHAVDSIERKEMLKNLGRYDDRLVSLLTQPPAADANTGAAVGLPSADDNQAPAAAAERSRAKHAKGRSGRDGQAAETGVGTDSRLVVPRRRSAIAAQREQQAAAAPTAPPTTPLEEELTFRDLAHLDDASLAEVLRSAQPQTVLLALAGAGNELVNRIQNRLPSAEAKQWRRKMEQIGPLRLRDVEHAQQQIARLVGRMAAQGAIRRPATHRLAKAA